MPLTVHNAHTWATFVLPSVNVTPNTRRLIETVMPYFPRGCKCITGYQDEEAQFWKVNYHWDLVVTMIDKGLAKLATNPNQPMPGWAPQGVALNLPDPYTGQLKLLKQQLMMNAPTPQHGYMNSPVEGQPKDSSTHERITKRWELLKVVKSELGLIVNSAKLKTIAPPAQAWDLAVAAVAKPGTSKHGEGWALDIEGPGLNQQIADISKALGATLAYNEKSHVHVEFPHGVKLPK